MTERRTAVTPLRSQSVAAMERTALPARAAEVSQLMNWSERTTLAVALGVVVAVCVFMVVVRVVDVGLVMQMGDVMLVQIRVIVRMLLCHEGAPYLIS